MVSRSNAADYEKIVGRLEAGAFEDEVCARMQTIIVDFQRIPAKPHGDGGLDGLSHGQERAYCCYGPEQEVRKLDNKGLKDDTVKKFSSDLRKLFELEFEKKKLRHAPNEELATIMGADRKIRHVRLIVSCFESHQVIGPLQTHFGKYKAASQLKFVDNGATLAVWGPKDLAAQGAVDDHTLFRAQHPSLIACVQTASAAELLKDAGGDFDAKFNDLKLRRPAIAANIDAIAEQFRDHWAAAIALDNDLSKNSLALHQVFESVRTDAALSAHLKSLTETDPYRLIETMGVEVANRFEQRFGDRFGHLTPRITRGIVGGLIGECPIDWRDDHA